MPNNELSRRGFIGLTALGAMGAVTEAAAREAPGAEPILLERPLSLEELPTPALLIDLDAFERNLKRVADKFSNGKIGVRPHAKTHKCPIIARKQLEAGAIGVCAAKVGEAEVLATNGIDRVLITSPVVSPEKINRVIALVKAHPGVEIVVDNPKTVEDFNQAAEAAGITLSVFIDLDPGTRRTGIAPGEPALKLREAIARCKSLSFGGLQAYAGHLMHVKGHERRKAASVETMQHCLETKALFEKTGFEVPVFTGGGTGTFDIDCEIDGVTDLQLGSYIFMDIQYREIGDADGEIFDYFEPSLFVLVTAISRPVEGLITVDGGYKAFATDAGTPQFRDIQGVEYRWGGDEHGICRLTNPSRDIKLGDKLALYAPHCDPTVNLYDFYCPYRNGRVEELWPIAARGKSQ